MKTREFEFVNYEGTILKFKVTKISHNNKYHEKTVCFRQIGMNYRYVYKIDDKCEIIERYRTDYDKHKCYAFGKNEQNKILFDKARSYLN